MKVINATKNKGCLVKTYSFKDSPKEFEKVIDICKKCKYFDTTTEFPYLYCNINCGKIDCNFCTPKCPLGKFILQEKQPSERLIYKERNGHFFVVGMDETNKLEKINAVVYKLMKYEESGLTPEEVKKLQKQKEQKQSFEKATGEQLEHFVNFVNKMKGKKIGVGELHIRKYLKS